MMQIKHGDSNRQAATRAEALREGWSAMDSVHTCRQFDQQWGCLARCRSGAPPFL